MASSLEALEALLQFREGVPKKINEIHVESHCVRRAMPVPNPLDPTQPHIIEGDSTTPVANHRSFRSRANSAASSRPSMAPVVTAVPNPLLTPVVERPMQHPMPAPVTAVKSYAPSTTSKKILNHGFVINNPTPMSATSSDANAKPIHALSEVEVRCDKILDALNSKPQRGKKRHNLSELERLELTRTRNREHAKSTRMKKKARLEELVDIEKKYLLLKEKEMLDHARREHLVHFVENAGYTSGQHESKDSAVSSRLIERASEEIMDPEFTSIDSVALTAQDSGMVKVSARGTDLESGNPKTLSGVVCVDFAPGTADICAALLYWASHQSIPTSVSFFPSVSVLSFSP